MKKIDIEQAEPIRKKFAPDWEIRKGTYLYKKVAFNDYNQMLRFLMAIEKPQIKLDHFADFMNFYNELTIAITTHDVKGLTQLDFELALYIDKALDQMDARQLEEDGKGWDDKRRLKMYNPDGDMYMGKSMPGKGKRLPDPVDKAQGLDAVPDEPTDFDFSGIDREKLKKVVAKLIPTLNNAKDEKVLRARFGIEPFDKAYTLAQIAKAMGVTPGVIRQREAKALRKLRHPDRARELRPFLDHIEEKWSASYKKSIDCSNPKGFSQKAHCAGRKKSNESDNKEKMKGFDPETVQALVMLKKKFPHASDPLDAMLKQVMINDVESDTNDRSHDKEIDDLYDRIKELEKKVKTLKRGT